MTAQNTSAEILNEIARGNVVKMEYSRNGPVDVTIELSAAPDKPEAIVKEQRINADGEVTTEKYVGQPEISNLVENRSWWSATDPDANNDEDADDETVATDGGRDESETFDDEAIEQALDENAAEGTPSGVRDILASIQRSVEAVWDVHMDAVEENAMELVAMDGDILVFADHTGQFWNEEFRHGELEDQDIDRGTRTAIKQLHHMEAREHTDYSWEVDDPVVVRKPADFDAGRRLAEAVVTGYIARGLTPAQAWAVWGVHGGGNSRNNWAARCGYDSHSGVSNPLRKAEEKMNIPLNS